MRYEFDAFGANLQCCHSRSLLLPLGSCEFFFESHVDQTVDRLGTRVEFTETEDLSKKSAGRRQRHGGGFRKREHKALRMLTCMVTGQPLVDASSSQGKSQHLGKDASQ